MATMHQLYETYFIVSGDGELPLDMLRYDCAFPATEEDARRAEHERGRRAVALVSRRPRDNGPNRQRWVSFGWKVEEVSEDGPLFAAARATEMSLGMQRHPLKAE